MEKESSNYDTVANMRTETVKQKTGRTWAEWFVIIDKFGGKKMEHKDIARHLYTEFHVPSWWCQMITVGFEQAIKGRRVHEQSRGYQISASKTFASPPRPLYALWINAQTRQILLDGQILPIRSKKLGRIVRFAWPDGGTIEVHLIKKAAQKTQIVISHTALPTQKTAGAMQDFWHERLVVLEKIFADTSREKRSSGTVKLHGK